MLLETGEGGGEGEGRGGEGKDSSVVANTANEGACENKYDEKMEKEK